MGQEAVNGRGIYPTLGKINTMKAYMFNTIIMKDMVMIDTADLRIAIEVPEDPHQAYIASYTIDDTDPEGKPRFTITFTTSHLLTRINTRPPGPPTSGFQQTKGVVPKFRMADGAWEITNGGREVFGEEGTRLMCWAHVIKPKLAALRKVNKALGEAILRDIGDIQWMAQSPPEFVVVVKLLHRHYTKEKKLSGTELALVTTFFEYFLAQWGPGSHAQNWFAGANPFSLTNNQGQEGYHKEVKRNHTFRSEFSLPQFIQAMEQLVSLHLFSAACSISTRLFTESNPCFFSQCGPCHMSFWKTFCHTWHGLTLV